MERDISYRTTMQEDSGRRYQNQEAHSWKRRYLRALWNKRIITESQPPRETIRVDQPTYEKRLRALEARVKEYRNDAKRQLELGGANFAAIYDLWVDNSTVLAKI